MEIKNSHILITGANRGIGKAVAMMCAEDKARLHLVLRTSDPELKTELLKAGATSVEISVVDLGSKNAIDQFLQSVKDKDFDILFNNAGQLTGGLLEEQPLEDIYSMLQVNVNALIQMTHGILPGMLRRKRGKIINHSSVAGAMNFPCASTYSASKAAVLAFTNCLKSELRGTGVTTLVLVTPGVDTRMYNDITRLYGRHFDLGLGGKGIPPKKYAQIIREAILEDLSELKPHGVTGLGLLLAQHIPKTFDGFVQKKFKRS